MHFVTDQKIEAAVNKFFREPTGEWYDEETKELVV